MWFRMGAFLFDCSVVAGVAMYIPAHFEESRPDALHDLIARERLGTIDLLKVDIEGAELGMFDAAPDADLLAFARSLLAE